MYLLASVVLFSRSVSAAQKNLYVKSFVIDNIQILCTSERERLQCSNFLTELKEYIDFFDEFIDYICNSLDSMKFYFCCLF